MQFSLLWPCLFPQCHGDDIWAEALEKKNVGRRKDISHKEYAQLHFHVAKASSTGEGVAGKAVHNCWTFSSILFSILTCWSVPIYTNILSLKSHLQDELYSLSTSLFKNRKTCFSIPHGILSSFPLSCSFVLQYDDLLLESVYLCYDVNSTLWVLFLQSPERLEHRTRPSTCCKNE